MTGQCPVCTRIVGTRPGGRLINHDALTVPGQHCPGSNGAPARRRPPEDSAPAWAVAMEERIMARLADVARGYRLPPKTTPARAPGGDAGRESGPR